MRLFSGCDATEGEEQTQQWQQGHRGRALGRGRWCGEARARSGVRGRQVRSRLGQVERPMFKLGSTSGGREPGSASGGRERKQETWTLGVSRGRKRHGLLGSREEARDMDSWSLERKQETWTHGVLREGKRHGLLESLGGSKRHELLKSQEKAGDVDSWSLERKRET